MLMSPAVHATEDDEDVTFCDEMRLCLNGPLQHDDHLAPSRSPPCQELQPPLPSPPQPAASALRRSSSGCETSPTAYHQATAIPSPFMPLAPAPFLSRSDSTCSSLHAASLRQAPGWASDWTAAPPCAAEVVPSTESAALLRLPPSVWGPPPGSRTGSLQVPAMAWSGALPVPTLSRGLSLAELTAGATGGGASGATVGLLVSPHLCRTGSSVGLQGSEALGVGGIAVQRGGGGRVALVPEGATAAAAAGGLGGGANSLQHVSVVDDSNIVVTTRPLAMNMQVWWPCGWVGVSVSVCGSGAGVHEGVGVGMGVGIRVLWGAGTSNVHRSFQSSHSRSKPCWQMQHAITECVIQQG